MKFTNFEHYECGRCAGSGYFKCWGHVYGGRCFLCHGAGYRHTKKGQAAFTFFFNSLCKPAKEVKVGEIAFCDGVPEVGIPSMWFKVESNNGGNIKGTAIKKHAGTACGFDYASTPERLVRVSNSAEEKEEKIKAALAFQETLTQAGTVRKNKK